MVSKKLRVFNAIEAKEFLNHVIEEKPLLPFLIPLGFFAWTIERWLVPFSNWVPLAFAVWATIQYGNFQRQLLLENMNKRWKQLILNTSPVTPLEPCEWLNLMMLEVWPNYLEPRISRRLSSVVERKMKHRKPKLIEKLEMQEFSLGSCPPNLGKNGMRWYTSGDQKVLQLGFDWDTNEMSIMLLAKLAKPLKGTARIVINQIHIKGDVLLIPVLDGQAILYSFESTPDVRIGVAFGSGTQTLPATELPGVSTWLVKLLTETIVKTMVEPRRVCYPLQSVKTAKTAVGGILSITVISADNLCPNAPNTTTMETRQSSKASNQSFGSNGSHIMQTFIEVELGSLRRRTNFSQGRNPRWDTTYNLVLLGNSEIIKFNLYERNQNSVKLNHLTSCEIKMKYVADDSTIFWAIGEENGVLIKHAECGKAVEMVVPFEEASCGELSVRLDLKEWQYADDSASPHSSMGNQTVPSAYSSSNIQLTTGRKLMVTVVEGKDLIDISGKCDPYVRLHYGKIMSHVIVLDGILVNGGLLIVISIHLTSSYLYRSTLINLFLRQSVYRTKTISQTSNPVWNQLFVLDELEDGDYLRIKCYSADTFGDENIGTAHVNMEGIHEGDCRDVWVPLEKVSSGELRLQIEAVKSDEYEEYKNSTPRGGIIELVIIEARDLVADMRWSCDPFVRVQYGNTKKNTKVLRKTLNPQWNQTLEFPDTGNRLILNVKDHNSLFPTYNIGNCVVEYERLPPNQTVDKWIPLQGVRSGEIHIQVTKRVSELQRKSNVSNNMPSVSDGHKISGKIREMLSKIHGLIEDGDFEGLTLALSEVESAEYIQEKYMLQLEKERDVLIDKISSIGHELHRTSSSPQ